MKRRIVLQQILPGRLDCYTFGRSCHSEFNVECYGNNGSNIYVLAKGSEPLTRNREVIGIKGNVRDGESSCTIRNCGSFETADRVVNLDGCVRDNRAGRIGYRTCH